MNILDSVQKAFPDEYAGGLSEQYEEMNKCKNIYKNKPPWAKIKKAGLYGINGGKRKMALLNTAKVLSDEFSALTFSEQVEITVNDEAAQDFVTDTLNKNGFWKNFPDFLSVAFATGGGVLKVYADNGKPCIDYIDGDNFVPTAWNGKGIFEGIFQSLTVKGGKYYTLIERHYTKNSIPCIENKLYCSENETDIGNQINVEALFPDLPEEVSYSGLDGIAMFQYFRPCISNNIDTDSPLGISVFSNAKDTLKALDIAFDSFSREFILGKKRIIVPSSCIRTVIDPESGQPQRYFDADDEVYVALKCDEQQDLKVTDNTTALRIEEHVSAINALLNILCFQTGLSAGTLSFNGAEGVKTATEVISRDSKTARTAKSNKNLLTEAIEGLVNAILGIGRYLDIIPDKDYEVTVGWQDNIVVDDNTLIDNNIKLVDAGLKSKLSAIMAVQKCDEETAERELKRIAEEQNISGLNVDNLFGGGEVNDTGGADES